MEIFSEMNESAICSVLEQTVSLNAGAGEVLHNEPCTRVVISGLQPLTRLPSLPQNILRTYIKIEILESVKEKNARFKVAQRYPREIKQRLRSHYKFTLVKECLRCDVTDSTGSL